MSGEIPAPNPLEQTPVLTHGEPIIISEPGDPGHEVKVAQWQAKRTQMQTAAHDVMHPVETQPQSNPAEVPQPTNQ